jgi:hypothetical protein
VTKLVDNAKHWRERAEEARALARLLHDPAAKRTMEGVAESYERVAQRAEERAKRAAEKVRPDGNAKGGAR